MYGTFSKHRRVANPRVAFANRVLKLRDLGKKTLKLRVENQFEEQHSRTVDGQNPAPPGMVKTL